VLRRSVETTAQSGHSRQRNNLSVIGQERTLSSRCSYISIDEYLVFLLRSVVKKRTWRRSNNTPYVTKQGIISAEQGILAEEQAILPTKPEFILG
jgi:hypothetical protein